MCVCVCVCVCVCLCLSVCLSACVCHTVCVCVCVCVCVRERERFMSHCVCADAVSHCSVCFWDVGVTVSPCICPKCGFAFVSVYAWCSVVSALRLREATREINETKVKTRFPLLSTKLACTPKLPVSTNGSPRRKRRKKKKKKKSKLTAQSTRISAAAWEQVKATVSFAS